MDKRIPERKRPRANWRMKFLLSYLVMILLPVAVFGAVIYFAQASQIRKEALLEAEKYADSMEARINRSLRELESLTVRLAMDASIAKIDTASTSYEQKIRRLAAFKEDKDTRLAMTPYISGYGFYYHSEEKMLTGRGYYSLPSLEDREIVEQVLYQENNGRFFVRSGEADRTILTVAKQVPWRSSPSLNFVYFDVDAGWLDNILSDIGVGESDMILVMLDSTGMVAAASDAGLSGKISRSPKAAYSGEWGEHLYVEKRAEDTGISYVCLVPHSHIRQRISVRTATIFYICLLLLLIGIILSFVLSKKMSSPINRLMDNAVARLKELKKGEALPEGEDISVISSALDEFSRYSAELEHMVVSNRTRLINSFFSSLLRGNRIDDEELEDMLEYCEISLNHPLFTILLLTARTEEGEGLPLTVRYRASACMERLAANLPEVDGFVVEVDAGHLCLVVNHREEQAVSPLKEALERELAAEFGMLHHNKIRQTPGLTVDSLHRINESWLSARAMLEYDEGERSTRFAASAPGEDSWLVFSMAHIEQLTAFLKTGELEGIDLMLDRMFQPMRGNVHVNIAALKGSIIQLLGFHAGSLRQQKINGAAYFTSGLYQEIGRLETVSEVQEWLKAFYGDMIVRLQLEPDNKKESKALLAVEYIHSHYREPLSLTDVAERLSISPQHLSTTFKQIIGMSFTDYVNRKRLEEASRLLKTSSLRVADIAEEVGYNNYNYFIRRFKEYYGTTPARNR